MLDSVHRVYFGGQKCELKNLATDEMYELLKSCWQKCPNQRPNFHRITKSLESIWETFEKEKFQQFLPKKVDEEREKYQEAKDTEQNEQYFEMKLKPKTTDSYIQIRHNGYNICLMDGKKQDENDNIADGVYNEC